MNIILTGSRGEATEPIATEVVGPLWTQVGKRRTGEADASAALTREPGVTTIADQSGVEAARANRLVRAG